MRDAATTPSLRDTPPLKGGELFSLSFDSVLVKLMSGVSI